MSQKFEAVSYLRVVDAVNRFTMLADHQEWDQLAKLMQSSIWIDYSDLDGQPAGRVDRRILISSWREQANGLDAIQHLLSNHCVDFSSRDRAVCRTHAQVYRTLTNKKGAGYWLLGGTYDFGMLFVGGAWKLDRIAWQTLWSSGNASIFELSFEQGPGHTAHKPLSTENPNQQPFDRR